MRVSTLLSNTFRVFPLTKQRYKTRAIKMQGKKVNKTFNTVTYRSLTTGGTVGTGVYSQTVVFSGSGLGESGFPKASSDVRLRCSCRSYKFYFAWANWRAGVFQGKPSRWTKTPSKRNNRRGIPGMCKHLVLTMKTLNDIGEIR